MKTLITIVAAALMALPACVESEPVPPPPPAYPADAQPPGPPPDTTPPPPPQASTSADGDWVYTAQYGWVWMPYDQRYTSVQPGEAASVYVFYPSFGWRWVAAPWVVGRGPRPHFAHGPDGFVRHGHRWARPRAYGRARGRGEGRHR